MELRQLKYLITVIEEASFTRAAAQLHVAQPGVSAQIRQLEREVGETLLDRSGRTVRATEAGLAMLPYARAALDAVASARMSVDELTGLVRGQVTVGTVASVAAVDLPGVLAEFHHRHPEVAIAVAEGRREDLVAQLRAGQVDMVLVGSGTTDAAMATQVVADEALIAIVGHDHPLAARATITIPGLRNRDLISLSRGTGLRACVDAAFASAGFEPRIAFEVSDPRVLVQFAARGLGIGLVSESIARAHADDVHTLTIARAPRARILLGWRQDGPISPAARALIRHARARLPELAGGR
jgi:DNA-binding transcriptional LysR family regulator